MCAIKMIIFKLIRKKENLGPSTPGDNFPELAHHSLQRVLLFVDPRTIVKPNIFQLG